MKTENNQQAAGSSATNCSAEIKWFCTQSLSHKSKVLHNTSLESLMKLSLCGVQFKIINKQNGKDMP